MKNNRFELYSILSVFLIYIIIFKTIILEKFVDLSQFINLMFLFCMLAVSIILFGFKKGNRSILRYRVCQTFILNIIIYYIVIYLFGLITGFLNNGYNVSLGGIFKNLYLLVPTLFVKELLRYNLLSKSKDNIFRIFCITINFICLDVFMEVNYYNFNNFEAIFKFIALLLLPNIISNILLSFTALKIDYLPNIIYVVLMVVPTYIIPVIPDLGNYIECIISILLPFIIMININNLLEQAERLPKSQKEKIKPYVYIPITAIMIALLMLVSGFFKYQIIAVLSDSMSPIIKRGDTVIIQKIKQDELNKLKEQMILVYKHNNKVIIHRIVEIKEKDGEYYFKTKGDNNNVEDQYPIYGNEVIGIVNLKIPYIGYPTVVINDFLNAS